MLTLLATIIITSCSNSSHEKALNGTWHGVSNITQNGIVMPLNTTLTLDDASHEFKMQMDFSIADMGEFISITSEGNWSADDTNISLIHNKDNIDVSISDNAKQFVPENTIDIVKQQLKEYMSSSLSSEETPYTLDDDILTINVCGQYTEFTRK